MVVMLLLDMLGVPAETIIEDYQLTASCCRPLLEQFRAEARQVAGPFGEWHLRMLECDGAFIAAALRHLRDRYGGAVQYLQIWGMSVAQIAHLQMELLE